MTSDSPEAPGSGFVYPAAGWGQQQGNKYIPPPTPQPLISNRAIEASANLYLVDRQQGDPALDFGKTYALSIGAPSKRNPASGCRYDGPVAGRYGFFIL